VVDTDGLDLAYSKLKLHSKTQLPIPSPHRARRKPLHAKVIEHRPRRQSAVA